MDMTENLKRLGYKYYRLESDGFVTGWRIRGVDKNLYIGAGAKYWTHSTTNIIHDRQIEIAREDVGRVLLKPTETRYKENGNGKAANARTMGSKKKD